MNKKFNFSLRTLLDNRRFSIIFSVTLAFIVWMAVVINQTPTIDRTITGLKVTIDTEGTVAGELGLDEVTGAVSTVVTIKVSGPAYVVSNLKESDFVISPSLANVTAPGTYTIPLTATKLNFGNEFSVTSITPSQLTLTFDYIDTKQITVVPIVNGVSAVQGLVAEEPVISNADESTVTVKGPRTEMSKIATVNAVVNKQEVLSETKTYDADIVLLDKNGEELDKSKYTLSAETVKVSVPISKRKTVPVRADFTNAPEGYGEFINYSVSVREVDIIGPAATVDQMDEVVLSPIDFFSISKENHKFDMAPVLSDGVKILDNIEAITVDIDTSGFAERTFTVSNVVAINNSNNYTVTLNSNIKNVKICAPREIINNIRQDTVYAVVDLTGKSAGEYNAAATIYSYSDKRIWQVGTYQASITIA